jgi:hypothetical protein
MLTIRPIVVDDKGVALGGNMRTRALKEIKKLGRDAIPERLQQIRQYANKPQEEKNELLAHWDAWFKDETVPVIHAESLTEEEKREFIIKDNSSFGAWDWDVLANEWESEQLDDWGVDVWQIDETENIETEEKETSKLSDVKFVDVYYEPEEIPNIKLIDCIDTELFDRKMLFINSLNLTDEMKDVMRLLAYRFIKIDFENVANYYAFNATDEEKKAIERLRCVLVDGAIDGFIEDRMLRVEEHYN